MKSPAIIVIFFAGVVSIAGCSDAFTSSTEVQRQSIEGGTEDTTTGASLALLNSQTGGVCSAVLVAPHLVLTARSCISEVMGSGSVCERSFAAPAPAADFSVTSETPLPTSGEAFLQVSEIFVPADAGGCGNDIALLELSEPFDAGEVEPIAPSLTGEVVVGDAYDFYGFGGDSSGSGSGVRRTSEGEVTCIGTDCEGAVAAGEFGGEDGACAGDAGGPAVAGGLVIGLNSRGSGSCASSVLTSVASHSSFLIETAENVSSQSENPLPDWADSSANNTTNNTNNGTNNSTNNVNNTVNNGTDNNGTGENNATGPDGGSSSDDDDSGCAAAGAAGASPILLAVFLIGAVLRRRR